MPNLRIFNFQFLIFKHISWTSVVIGLLVYLFIGLFPPSAGAAVGIHKTINFQGKLTGNTGLNVADGNYTVVFTLYDAASNGNNLWDETQSVTTVDGIFQVELGSVDTTLENVNFNSDSIYLGIKVGADSEMTPRIRFGAVPYAFNSTKVNGLAVTNMSGNPFSSATTLQIGDGKTVVISNGLTLAGTDSTTITFQGTDTYVGRGTNDILTNKSIGSTGLTFNGATTDITTFTNEDLTFDINGSGDLVMNSDFNSGVSIGSSSNTPAPLSISGGIGSNASLIVNNNNSGDLFVASQGGSTKFRVANNGDVVLTAGISMGVAGVGTSSQCLLGGATASWGTCGTGAGNYWNLTSNGLLYNGNLTTDFAIGGATSSSASFLVSPSTTRPTASVSGNTNQAALVVDNRGTGNLFTASSSGTTRFIINNAGNVGIGTGTVLGSTGNLVNGLTIGNSTAASTNAPKFVSVNEYFNGVHGSASYVGNWATTANNWGLGAATTGTADNTLRLGMVNANTNNWSLVQEMRLKLNGANGLPALASLDIATSSGNMPVASFSGITNKSSVVIDQSGTGDIFTASKSGATKFVINNNGDLQWAGSNNFLSTLNSAAATAQTWTLPNATGTICLQASASCGFSLGTNYWQSLPNTGAISPFNTTYDVLFGGTSTVSARFAFLNNTGVSTTPTASISANSGNIATTLTGTGVLGTTNRQTLTIGNATTGNINFYSASNVIDTAGNVTLAGTTHTFGNGSAATLQTSGNANLSFTAAGSGDIIFNTDDTSSIGIGTTTPLSTLDIRGNIATIPAASVSASSTDAAMVVNNNGTGDLFTASKSGATKFVIKNDGTLGFGEANYTDCGSLSTDSLAELICGTAGSRGNGDKLLAVYAITAPSGVNLTLNFNGAANSAPSSASGTITLPSNASKMVVQLKAGGGGGGGTGTANLVKTTGGGGEGGYSQEYIASLASNYYIKVGAGGNGGGSGANGQQGTESCFGTNASDACTNSVAKATGGAGSVTNNAAVSTAGGSGGSGSGGDLNITGASGTNGAGATGSSFSGTGGGIGGGKGITTAACGTTGNAGANGGGGSGAFCASNTQFMTGGAGGSGYVLLYIYSSADGGDAAWTQFTGGVLAPADLTTDVLIGGNSTASARFGILNMAAGGTPIASLSAGAAGGAYLTATGILQTTANQTLTLGGTTTGNVIINPQGSNFVGIGTSAPLAPLDVRTAINTVPSASISANSTFGALIVDNRNNGDIFAASSSGLNRFVIKQNGAIGIGTTVPQANKLDIVANYTPTADLVDIGNVAGQEPTGNGINALQLSWFTKPASNNFGSAQRINITNNNTGTGGQAQGLRIVGTGAGALRATDTVGLYIDGLLTASAGTTGQNAIEVGTNWDNTLFGQGDIRINANGNIILATSSATTRFGYGTTNPLATFDIRAKSATAPVASLSGSTSGASLLVDNSGTGDLVNALSNGVTQFVVKNGGQIGIGTNTPVTNLDIRGASTATASISAGLLGAAYLTGSGSLQTTNNQSLILGGTTTGNILVNHLGGNYTGIGTNNPLASLDIRSTIGLNGGTISIASVSGKTSYAAMVVNNMGTGDIFTASAGGMTRFRMTQTGNTLFQGDIIAASGSGQRGNGSATFVNALGDQGSLIPNASFESNTYSPNGIPDGWLTNASSSATAATYDRTTAVHGDASLKVTVNNSTVIVNSTCVPIQLSNLTGSYTATYYAKASQATTFPTLRGYVDTFTSKANCQTGTTPITSAPMTTNVLTASFAISNPALAVTNQGAGTWARIRFFVHSAVASNNSVNIDGVRLVETAATNGLDYAENYPVDPANMPDAGDVVALRSVGGVAQVTKAVGYMNQDVIGVVSTNPGQTLDDGSMGELKAPVALAGRIPTKVSTKNGVIHVGDYLTSSDMPGVAVKALNAGQVIGQAMEEYTEADTTKTGKVVMFVKNTYYNGFPLSLNSGLVEDGAQPDLIFLGALIHESEKKAASVSALTQLKADKVVAGLSVVAPNVVTDTVQLNSIKPATGKDVTIELPEDGSLIVKNASSEAGITFKGNGDANFAGTITADKLVVRQIEISGEDWNKAFEDGALESLEARIMNQESRITDLEALFASASAVVEATTTPTPVASESAFSFLAKMPTIEDFEKPNAGIFDFANLSKDSLATYSGKLAADKLQVTGSAIIEGILHVVDFLTTRNLIVDQLATFLGDSVFKGNVLFESTPTFSSDTAGLAVIKKGSDHVEVKFSKAYDVVPLVSANLTVTEVSPIPHEDIESLIKRQDALEQQVLGSNARYVVTKRTTKGFTIMLAKPATDDMTFSWMAVGVDKPVVQSSNGDKSQVYQTSDNENARPISSDYPSTIPTSSILKPTEAILPFPPEIGERKADGRGEPAGRRGEEGGEG